MLKHKYMHSILQNKFNTINTIYEERFDSNWNVTSWNYRMFHDCRRSGVG